MDIIYNGEIYLKKGPEIYNPSADIKEIDEKIEELKKVLTEEEFISIWNDPKERKKVRISWKWF